MEEVSPYTKVEIGASGVQEIVQNVAMILSTPKGSLPLDREFGTNWHFVDQPTPKAVASIRKDIVQTVSKYEPRARVREIDFTDSKLNSLIPTVRLEILSV
jgi:hypothetical protein